MKIRDLLILAGCLGAASHASALALGPSQGHVILGQPLDLSFQVRPSAGLTAEHSCITAAIRMGDHLLADRAMNVLFNGSDRVRVRSRVPVNEPVVSVELAAGCESTVRRSYTFFADPPSELIHSATPLQLPTAPPVVSIPVDSPAVQQVAPRLPAPPAVRAAPATRPAPAPRLRASATAQPGAVKATAPAPTPAPAPAPSTAAPASAAAAASTDSTSAPAAAAAPAAATTASGDSRPTLRMEALEGLGHTQSPGSPNSAVASDEAAQSAAAAAGLPSATPDTPSPSAAADGIPVVADPRLALLESMLERMQAQQKLDRQQMLALQTQLQQAQSGQELPAWVLAMMGLLGLSAGTILWLLHRVRTEKAHSERWAQTVQTAAPTHSAAMAAPPAPPPAAPAAPPALHPPVAHAPAPASGTVMPVSATAATLAAMLDSAPASPAAPQGSLPPLESVHAFASVQEQAEFFLSLGQQQQAIELLNNHLLQNSRTSPKGYLWLLQLLAEQQRHEEFARTRAEFEQRFNVVVPESTAFHRKGRDLATGYPETLEQLEAAWPHNEALPLLRSLITRSEQGLAAQRRFELQAFDALLALYDAACSTPAHERRLPLPVPAPAPAAAAPTAQDMPAPAAAALGHALPTNDDPLAAFLPTPPPLAPAASAAAPATAAAPAAWEPPALGNLSIDISALQAPPLEELAVTSFAPETPAFAPATTGAPSWVTPAAAVASAAVAELPDLPSLQMLEPSAVAPQPAPAASAALSSPLGGPQLSAPDDALLQSLQLDLADSTTPIASTPSTHVAVPMPREGLPMLDLNDFLSAEPVPPTPAAERAPADPDAAAKPPTAL